MKNSTLKQVCWSLLLAGLLFVSGTTQEKCTDEDSNRIQTLMLDSHYSIDGKNNNQNIVLAPLPVDQASLNDRGIMRTSIRFVNETEFKLQNQTVLALMNAERVKQIYKHKGLQAKSFSLACTMSLKLTLISHNLMENTAKLSCEVSLSCGPASYVASSPEIWDYKDGVYTLVELPEDWSSAG
ncbi:hypothetical protein N9061_02490 [bacterium]|nr:hypothetical protein [bacterium]